MWYAGGGYQQYSLGLEVMQDLHDLMAAIWLHVLQVGDIVDEEESGATLVVLLNPLHTQL